MPDTSRRDRLRAELMQVRVRAGLSGRALGVDLKSHGYKEVKQATISRVERGETVPSVPMVRAWLSACGVEDDPGQRVVDLAEAAQAETRGWSELLGADGHAQREAAVMEQACTALRVFQPTVTPGLLQTPETARALFAIGRTRDVEAAVAARVARQKILYESGRTFTFLIAENALRWPLGGPEVHAGQLDRIVTLSRLPTVEVAVVPQSVTVVAGWNNFQLWALPDEPTRATAEVFGGETDTSDGETLDWFETVWSRLWDVAVRGDEAVNLIRATG